MENKFEDGFDDDQNILTDQAFRYLDAGARWARFLAIVGYVSIGLMVMAALFILVAGVSFRGRGMYSSDVPLGLMSFAYIIAAVLYFFPVHYLYTFASKAREAFIRRDAKTLETAMRFMNLHYQFLGILMIIALSLYGLLLLIGLLAAAGGGFR
jgi:hypothetical protein